MSATMFTTERDSTKSLSMRGLAGVLTLGLFASACSSPALYGSYRKRLADAESKFQAGEHAKAAKVLELFLVETSSARDEYQLQRFFADYLLTLVHEAASFESSFLSEASQASGGSFSVESAGGSNRNPSPLGHAVAVTYYGAYARDAFPKARSKPAKVEGVDLLPAKLASLGSEDALRHLNLSLLAVYSRFHFDKPIQEIIRDTEEMQSFEACEALLERVGVNAAARPWIYRGAFEYAKGVDEHLAYKLGIRARQTAADSHGSMGRDVTDSIAHWIEEESSVVFVSRADLEFSSAMVDVCPASGEPLIEFRPEPREQWEARQEESGGH